MSRTSFQVNTSGSAIFNIIKLVFQSTDVKLLIQSLIHRCIFMQSSICYKQCFKSEHLWFIQAQSGNTVFSIQLCFLSPFTFWDLLYFFIGFRVHFEIPYTCHLPITAGIKGWVLGFDIFWNYLLLSTFSHLTFSLRFGIS